MGRAGIELGLQIGTFPVYEVSTGDSTLVHFLLESPVPGVIQPRRRAARPGCGQRGGQAFPLSDVQAYMGHADVATTMIYVHHVPTLDAAERLSALVAAETAPEMQAVAT